MGRRKLRVDSTAPRARLSAFAQGYGRDGWLIVAPAFGVRCLLPAGLRRLNSSDYSTPNVSGRLHRRGRRARRGFAFISISATSASSAVNLLNSQLLRAFDVRRSMFGVRFP